MNTSTVLNGHTDQITKPASIETIHSWFIQLVSFLLIYIIMYNILTCPVYYVVYVEYFEISKSIGSWLHGIFSFFCFSVGFISSHYTNRYGCRVTTLVGGLIASVAYVIASFSNHIAVVFILHGTFAGIGSGIAFIGANVIITHYFDKHRALASGLCLTSFGVAMISAPVLVTYLIEMYSWRGALLLQGAINMHMLPLGLAMVERKPILFITENIKKERLDEKTLKDILNPLFILYCVSNLLVRINTNTILPIIPDVCVEDGFTLDQAAVVATVSGISGAISILGAGLISIYPSLNHLLVYGSVNILNGLSSILFKVLSSYWGKCVSATVIGISVGVDYALVPVTLVQLEGVNNLARAMGVYNLIALVPAMSFMPPVSGALFESTGSYTVSFYIGFAASATGSLLSIALGMYIHRRKKTCHKPGTEIATIEVKDDVWWTGKEVMNDVTSMTRL